MRKLKLIEHMSLDGIMQISPCEGSDFPYGDWTAPYRTPAGLETILAAFGEKFDLLLGRRTYDQWSQYWPKALKSPLADRLNAATKYIATHRPETLQWGPVQGIGPDLVEGVRNIKATAGADIILSGSSTLTSSVLEHGLADELMVIVYPVLLGTGKRLFADNTPARTFTHEHTLTLPTGQVVTTYKFSGSLEAVGTS